MKCNTMFDIGDGIPRICGHSVTQHEGDESGMGGPEPCMVGGCPCENFTDPRLLPNKSVDLGGDGRRALLDHIGNDQRLHAFAANGEGFVKREHPRAVPGSSQFYQKVLEYVRTQERKPALPTFEAPPSFNCGMEE